MSSYLLFFLVYISTVIFKDRQYEQKLKKEQSSNERRTVTLNSGNGPSTNYQSNTSG
jgi:hypothetical protein